MEIDIKNIMAAYETATESEKTLLSTLFPDLSLGQTEKAPDDRPVTERIKTFEDARLALGEEHPLVKEWHCGENLSSDLEAYLQLRVICAALNEGWEPQFTEDEWRYYPWFWLYTQDEIDNMDEDEKKGLRLMSTGDYQTGSAGLAFAYSTNAPSYSASYFASRLCLKSDTLAVYAGKQFMSLWADFYLIRKSK